MVFATKNNSTLLPTVQRGAKNIILLLSFDSESDLNEALIRPCNYYEGTVMKHGMVGINFDRNALQAWRRETETFSKQESRLLAFIDKYDIQYVIGYVQGDASTRKHELAHALYAMDGEYHDLVQRLWNEMSPGTLVAFEKELSARGYLGDKVIDEWQAYLAENPIASFAKKFHTLPVLETAKILENYIQNGQPDNDGGGVCTICDFHFSER